METDTRRPSARRSSPPTTRWATRGVRRCSVLRDGRGPPGRVVCRATRDVPERLDDGPPAAGQGVLASLFTSGHLLPQRERLRA